jgi:glyoxylase-like metal-dependent hydrolase (beta-lactamase superfamily II)
MAEDVLFTGDTLFRGSCGRTDFPGGSWSQMCKSLKRLYELPGDYAVLCGHTGSSKLSFERQTNDFMRSAVQE